MSTGFGQDIKAIVEGCSIDARVRLLYFVANAVSTLNTLDTICPIIHLPCHDYLKSIRFDEMFAALRKQVELDHAQTAIHV